MDPSKTRPGWVVLPDGSKEFVQDTRAYFQQHPELQWKTTAAIDPFALLKDQVQASQAEAAQAKRSAMTRTTQSPAFTHTCVGGKVPKTCDKCMGHSAR